MISKNFLKYHLYADDTQLYISFTPTNSALSLEILTTTTFNDILSWMNLNKLLLNQSKTKFLLIGTKQQRLKFSDQTNLSLSNDIIPVSSSARNFGFIFDSDMSFSDRNQLCIQSLSFSYPRHPSNSSSSSSLYSHSSCKFTCLQQTWQLQFTLLWYLTNKSQQTSTHSKFIGTCHHKHFKISTHHTNTQKIYIGFLSNKESITKSVFSHTKHLQINNLHISTIVFHFRHILFLQDFLIHLFFPFHMSDLFVTFSRPRSSTAPLLKHLHWLPVSARIHFKIALLTFKSLHAIAPSYLSSLVRPYVPSRALRSSSAHQLCVPHVSTVFGSRGFRSAGPTIWNSLPLSVTSCSTIHTFKKQLKTHLFASAFPSSWIVLDAPLIRWSPFMYLFGCPWFCACLNVCYYYYYY